MLILLYPEESQVFSASQAQLGDLARMWVSVNMGG